MNTQNVAVGVATLGLAINSFNLFAADVPAEVGRFASTTVAATQKTGVLPSPVAHEVLPAGAKQTTIFAVVRPDGHQINQTDAQDWVFHVYRENGLDLGSRAVHQRFGSGDSTLSYHFDDSLKAYAPAQYKGPNTTFLVVDFVPGTEVQATTKGFIAVEDNEGDLPGPHTFNLLIGPAGSPIYNRNWVKPGLEAVIRDVNEGKVTVEAVHADPSKPVHVLASETLSGNYRLVESFDPRTTTGVVIEAVGGRRFFRLKQE